MKLVIGISILVICLGFRVSAPTEWSWDNVDNINYLGVVRNQNYPAPCNSGWAIAATSTLSSRIKIARKAQWPDVTISPQVLIDCDNLDFGCYGGDPWSAFKWIQTNDITDDTCSSYSAKTSGRCTSASKCMRCIQNVGCVGISNSKVYGIANVSALGGEEQMMSEIYASGPIVCGIAQSSDLKNYTKGILTDKSGNKQILHYVMVYGWGVENGIKYWKAQNSWGSQWGESGSFRIVKGVNNLGIETECSSAIPRDTWTNDIRNTTPPSPSVSKVHFDSNGFDWRHPVNYLTNSRTDRSPKFCSSAWALAVVQTLSDKIKIVSKGKTIVHLSAQVLLNCGAGTCSKGTADDAVVFVKKYGLPEESCQNYMGEVPSKAACSDVQNCGTCAGTIFNYSCAAVKSNKRWMLPDYGKVSGASSMKKQLENYGPFICSMHVTPTFLEYTGGIFSEITILSPANHYVEIVGYGSEKGTQYWVARNFWGTTWGESGFFRIQMHSNNLSIEKDCTWIGTPN